LGHEHGTTQKVKGSWTFNATHLTGAKKPPTAYSGSGKSQAGEVFEIEGAQFRAVNLPRLEAQAALWVW